MRAINKLATAPGKKDTLSLTDVKGLVCPKEFIGGRKTLSTVVEEDGGILCGSEMMLEWSAEQATDMTTTAIDLEFLPTVTNVERGVQNLEFVLQQMHTALMVLTSYEANDIVPNSWKNPLEAWRRLRNVMIQRQVEGNDIC